MYRGDKKLDTDIQFNYTSLTLHLDQRLDEELRHYENIIKLDEFEMVKNMISLKPIEPFYYRSESQKEIIELCKECQYFHYTLDDRVIFVSPIDNGRYFHRLKKNGKWSVDDAIQYQ